MLLSAKQGQKGATDPCKKAHRPASTSRPSIDLKHPALKEPVLGDLVPHCLMQELQQLQDHLQQREQRLLELEGQWKRAVRRQEQLQGKLTEAREG